MVCCLWTKPSTRRYYSPIIASERAGDSSAHTVGYRLDLPNCAAAGGRDLLGVWSWVYVDKAAPPEIKEAFRLAGIRGFSPSGTFEQDDMDNWQECTQTGRGVIARRHMINMQMGLVHEGFSDELGAWASDHRISESNHREFYRRWD